MANFPLLNTGAVAQYPLMTASSQGTGVIRFLDGSDQRFSLQGREFRQWQIRVSLLNEDELNQLAQFFAQQLGDYQTFAFPDPISGTLVPNCRFAEPEFNSDYAGLDMTGTSFWVIETNG